MSIKIHVNKKAHVYAHINIETRGFNLSLSGIFSYSVIKLKFQTTSVLFCSNGRWFEGSSL